MTPDVYKTPKSSLEETPGYSNGQIIKMYSPNQVACGTIGGPVGLVYFLMSNFSALNKEKEKKKTLIIGGVFIVLIAALMPFLPDNVPSAPFTIAYIVIARLVAEKYQMTKVAIATSEQHDYHSN